MGAMITHFTHGAGLMKRVIGAAAALAYPLPLFSWFDVLVHIFASPAPAPLLSGSLHFRPGKAQERIELVVSDGGDHFETLFFMAW